MDMTAFGLGFGGLLSVWAISLVFLVVRRATDGLV